MCLDFLAQFGIDYHGQQQQQHQSRWRPLQYELPALSPGGHSDSDRESIKSAKLSRVVGRRPDPVRRRASLNSRPSGGGGGYDRY